MSKKKITALIAVSVLFFYCVSAVLTFLFVYNERTVYQTEADYKTTETYASVLSDYAKSVQRNMFVEKLSLDCPRAIGAAYDSPYIYAVFNSEGRRLETRGLTLDWYEMNADGTGINTHYHGDISVWLTADARASLEAFVKKCRYHAVEVRAASFSDQRSGFVPTQLSLYSLFEPSVTFALPLAPFQPTVFVETYESAMLHLDLFDLAAGRDAKRYARLIGIADEFEAQILEQGGFAKNAVLAEHFGKKVYGIAFAEEASSDAPFAWLRRMLAEEHLNWNVLPVQMPEETQYLFTARLDNDAQDVLFSAGFGIIEGGLFVLFALAGTGLILLVRRMLTAQEKQLAARKALTDAAAHELKTPLAVIRNQTECIMENVAPEKNGDYIASVYAEAGRMDGIVNALLRYNRLADMKKTEKSPVDLCAIVREEAARYGTFAADAGVAITLSLPETYMIEGNPDMLRLAVDNYLSNAVKYASGEKRVAVSLKTKGKRFALEVYNDCTPLSAKAQRDVWEMFSRGDKARVRDGASTGLGLPTCAAIFRLHRLRYGCRAEEHGMTFRFGTMK